MFLCLICFLDLAVFLEPGPTGMEPAQTGFFQVIFLCTLFLDHFFSLANIKRIEIGPVTALRRML